MEVRIGLTSSFLDMGITMINEREYRVTRFSSIVGYGSKWRVINEVTGLEGEIVYRSYHDAKQGAVEVADHYRTIERNFY